MRYLLTIAVVSLSFFTFYFSDNPASPTDEEQNGEFLFQVKVKDNNGNPVSGIRVSAWNHLSDFGQSTTLTKSSAFRPLVETTFMFSIKSVSKVIYSIFNLENELEKTLVDQKLVSGLYSVLFPSSYKPSSVFNCILTAKDTLSETILFKDSVYAVLWHPDPEVSVFGFTASNGVFETREKLLFPNLFDLPAIPATAISPDIVGSFSISDSVTIVLTNTINNLNQEFTKVVKPGTNSFDLVWNPSSAQFVQSTNYLVEKHQSSQYLKKKTSTLSDWKIYQNYPNPFN